MHLKEHMCLRDDTTEKYVCFVHLDDTVLGGQQRLIEHSDYVQILELALNTEVVLQSCKLLFLGEYMLTSASMLISLCVLFFDFCV